MFVPELPDYCGDNAVETSSQILLGEWPPFGILASELQSSLVMIFGDILRFGNRNPCSSILLLRCSSDASLAGLEGGREGLVGDQV